MERIGKEIGSPILGRDLQWKKSVEAADSPGSARLAREGTRTSSCVICGNHATPALTVRGVDYLQCKHCDHLFCGVMPDDEFLRSLYSRGESSQNQAYVTIEASVASERKRSISYPKSTFIDEVASVSRNGTEKGLWIDLGSGVGDLLFGARNAGYRVLGIEASKVEAEIAREADVNTLCFMLTESSVHSLDLGDAEIVSMLNFVEHLPNPWRLLRPVAQAMREGSFLAIEVPRHPSVSSIMNASGLGPVYRHINPPEHLNIFSDASMHHLLDGLGFETVGTWRYGSDAVEIFTAVGALLGWTEGLDSPRISAGVNALQFQIDRSGLSDVLLAVGRKRGS